MFSIFRTAALIVWILYCTPAILTARQGIIPHTFGIDTLQNQKGLPSHRESSKTGPPSPTHPRIVFPYGGAHMRPLAPIPSSRDIDLSSLDSLLEHHPGMRRAVLQDLLFALYDPAYLKQHPDGLPPDLLLGTSGVFASSRRSPWILSSRDYSPEPTIQRITVPTVNILQLILILLGRLGGK